MNFYEILGVAPTASAQAIKQAYKRESAIKHPDKGGDEAEFKLLNEAYQVLGDSEKRAEYDAVLGTNVQLYDSASATIVGYLPSAGVPYSLKFRQQHHTYTVLAHSNPLSKEQKKHVPPLLTARVAPFKLAWLNQHYAYVLTMEQRERDSNNFEELSAPPLTAPHAIKILAKFLERQCYGASLTKLIIHIEDTLTTTEFSDQEHTFIVAVATLLSTKEIDFNFVSTVQTIVAFMDKADPELRRDYHYRLAFDTLRHLVQADKDFYTYVRDLRQLGELASNKKPYIPTATTTLTIDVAITILTDFIHLRYYNDGIRSIKLFMQQAIKPQTLSAAELDFIQAVLELISIDAITTTTIKPILNAIDRITRYSNQVPTALANTLSMLFQSHAWVAFLQDLVHCTIAQGGASLPDSRPQLAKLRNELIANFSYQTEHEKRSTIIRKRFYDMQDWFERDLFTLSPIGLPSAAYSRKAQPLPTDMWRERIFHMLDWYPAVLGLGENKHTVEHGMTFSLGVLANYQLYLIQQLQKLARIETDNAMAMADERLALDLLLEVIAISQRLTPAIELYLIIQVLPLINAFQYQLTIHETESLATIAQHLTQRVKVE